MTSYALGQKVTSQNKTRLFYRPGDGNRLRHASSKPIKYNGRMFESLGKLARLQPGWARDMDGLIHFQYVHRQDYLPGSPDLLLDVLLLADDDDPACLVTTNDIMEHLGGDTENSAAAFFRVAETLSLKPVSLTKPMRLEPVIIPKPWGRELWYSGIESRGVSTVEGLPLAWLTDIFGAELGCAGSPVLLKILDPHPDSDFGDLYFEMHEQKVEVYIVTHLDSHAWPDDVGRIRYGFNQSLLADYDSREAFLTDYVAAVRRYQHLRDQIDDQLARLRAASGQDPESPVQPDTHRAWMGEVATDLREQEATLREAMYKFTALRTLKAGDVITVSPFFPHSLQHGVRVVEFQTPHYERYILSFTQRVLTQDHWDTEQVLNHALTDDPPPSQVRPLGPGRELIADFEAFTVVRYRLEQGQRLPLELRRYALVMSLTGHVSVDDVHLEPESALLLPPGVFSLGNNGREQATLLLAREPDIIAAEDP